MDGLWQHIMGSDRTIRSCWTSFVNFCFRNYHERVIVVIGRVILLSCLCRRLVSGMAGL